jgi:mannose-6-phosphate isomerase-like protein (cupin superfamily)
MVRERLFDGDGQITVRSLLNNEEEMYHKGRVFAHTTLPPGCSIGYHIHSDESETYYILSGIGEFNDNGTLKTVHPGDVTFTPAGQGHGIRNVGDEPLELIALILYK